MKEGKEEETDIHHYLKPGDERKVAEEWRRRIQDWKNRGVIITKNPDKTESPN